ncbi:MAG: hypothetical protein AABY74_04355 [Planctomycetota bacterium]
MKKVILCVVSSVQCNAESIRAEAPCKDNKRIQAPKGRQDALSFPSSSLGMCLCQKLQLHFVFVIKQG